MTAMTFTTSAATPIITNAPNISVSGAFKTLGRFAAVFFGVNADKSDDFRGLDLNGNAVWSRQNS